MRNVLWLFIIGALISCSEPARKGGQQQEKLALEKVISHITGRQVELPKGLTQWKKGQDFVWLSDNEVQTMRNICLYTYPGNRLDEALVVSKRDSVMRSNIPGEREGMYMHTEEQVPVSHSRLTWKGIPLLRSAGLWEMEGDAMGGPFVCHSRVDSTRGCIVVAEAFVYAPGRDKREVMKRLEAQLLKLIIH
jgi:hypothetical protein